MLEVALSALGVGVDVDAIFGVAVSKLASSSTPMAALLLPRVSIVVGTLCADNPKSSCVALRGRYKACGNAFAILINKNLANLNSFFLEILDSNCGIKGIQDHIGISLLYSSAALNKVSCSSSNDINQRDLASNLRD